MAANETLSRRTLFKFLLSLMGICMTSVLLFGNDQKTWAVFPALLITLYLSAADIRPKGEHLCYRHFVVWRKLPDDVVAVRCSLLPALGCVRFRHFLPPFGLLFFIVERGSGRFVPFRRAAFMSSMLPSMRRGEVSLRSHGNAQPDKVGKAARFITVLCPVAGLLAGVLVRVPWQSWAVPMNDSLLSRYVRIQQHPAALCLYSVALVALTMGNRRCPAVSFALTFLLGTVVARLVQGAMPG